MLVFALPALAASPVLLPDARFALALYCNPTCGDAVLDQLDADLGGIESVEGFTDFQGKPARVMGIAGTEFGIPDAAAVASFGVDVDRPEDLARSSQVVIAWFAGPRDEAVSTFASAHAAFARAASSAKGWVEDLDTRRIYGAAAWAKANPQGNLDDWYVIDAEPMSTDAPEGKQRLVTRGLRRFGDIELVVEDIPAEAAADVSTVVAAVAREIERRGEVAASMAVDDEGVRGTARLTELPSRRETDPESPIARLKFDGSIGDEAPAPAPAPAVASLALPAEAAPPPPPPSGAPRTLAEAKAQVQKELAGRIRAAFAAGLPAGDKFAVSAPFSTRGGGKEYLWIEVERWTDQNLVGVLVTQPTAVEGLQKGDKVSLRQDDILDYVWKHADGSREGNLSKGLTK